MVEECDEQGGLASEVMLHTPGLGKQGERKGRDEQEWSGERAQIHQRCMRPE